jgi:Flp pilus assembly protein TadD
MPEKGRSTQRDSVGAKGKPWLFRHRLWWLALLSAVLIFLCYSRTLGYELVWDDTIFLSEMPTYRDPTLWLSALFQPFVLSPNYFRPLAILTFVFELRVAGVNSTVFHLTNVLLHALNTALVTLLVRRIVPREGAIRYSEVFALGMGLVYGLHPALIEGVAFISSRFDLLMTTFLLLALLADLHFEGRRSRPLLVGLAFLLGSLAKEMALSLALALPFWHIARQERQDYHLRGLWKALRKRGDLWVYGAVFAAGLCYLGIRSVSLGYLLLQEGGNPIPTGSFLQHLLLVCKSAAAYLLLVLWPFTSLAPIHHSEMPISFADPWAWVSVAVVGLLVAGLVLMIRRTRRAGWLALGGILALLPVVNLLPLELGGGSYVAERYLIFPLVLLVLAVALLLHPWFTTKQGSWAERFSGQWILLLVWLAISVFTIQRILPRWRDDTSLWEWAAQRAPRSDIPPTNLALQAVQRGEYEIALELARRAIELSPENANAWNNAGLALFHLGRYVEAESAFAQAVELEPESALYWNNLAGALREQGRLAEAEVVLLDEALHRDPNLPAGHLNLGVVYLRADRPDLAAIHLQEAVRLLPPGEIPAARELLLQTQEPDRWLRLGDLQLVHGEYEAAIWAYERARELGASEPDVAAGLSGALIDLGDWESARQVLEAALMVAPNDPRLHNNLGVIAREQGDIEKAREYFQRAAELAPEWDLPRQNLEALPGD